MQKPKINYILFSWNWRRKSGGPAGTSEKKMTRTAARLNSSWENFCGSRKSGKLEPLRNLPEKLNCSCTATYCVTKTHAQVVWKRRATSVARWLSCTSARGRFDVEDDFAMAPPPVTCVPPLRTLTAYLPALFLDFPFSGDREECEEVSKAGDLTLEFRLVELVSIEYKESPFNLQGRNLSKCRSSVSRITVLTQCRLSLNILSH